MRAIVRYLIILPIALLILAFSIANRHVVNVFFDPFAAPADPADLELPLFVIILAVAVLGILLGGLLVWVGQSRHRRNARQAQREIERLRSEVAHAASVANVPAARQE